MRVDRLVCSAGVVLAALGAEAHQTSNIPDPSTDAMEPQVASKIAVLRQAVSEAPRASSAWGALGRTFHAHGLENEAEHCYRRAAELDPTEFRWPYLLALVLKSSGTTQALEMAQRTISLNPGYAPAHLLAAELFERRNEIERAMASYRTALSLDARSAAAELGLGRLLAARGELDAALEHLERAARYQPEAGPVQSALARLHLRRGDREKAEAAAAKARSLPAFVRVEDSAMTDVSSEAVSSRGYERRALAAEAAGDVARAESLYERLAALRPGDADLLYNFANLYVRQRRLQEAVARYEQALEAEPEHVAARVNLGNALVMMGRLEEGAVHLHRALERAPEDADAHRTLGQLRAHRGDFRGAIAHFRAVLAERPAEGETHRALAIVLAREGEFEEAWAHVEAARRLGSELPAEFLSRLKAAHPPR